MKTIPSHRLLPSLPPSRRRARVPHEIRPAVRGALAIVWRLRPGLPDLRSPHALRRLEDAFQEGRKRDGFALLRYTIRQDHLSLVVEARNRRKLSQGMQALGIRVAKSLNAQWRGRKGGVFAERYAATALSGRR